MLYGNNTRGHSSTSGPADDLFNKNRLAEEAKRDRAGQEMVQKQQEKNKLQLQIDNDKRELDKLTLDLTAKERREAELKASLAEAKRVVFLLETQIKKQEGGVNYLDDQANLQGGQEASQEVALSQLKTKKDSIIAEINKLKKEIIEREGLISSKTIESERLEQQYKSLETGAKQTKSQKSKVTRGAQVESKKIKEEKQELIFKKRIIEQLERDNLLMMQEVAKLIRGKISKERQIEDLKRKRDMIR